MSASLNLVRAWPRHLVPFAVAAAAVGALAVREPSVAIAAVGAVTLLSIVPAHRLILVPFVVALGGALVFGYGFANLGIPTAVPIPLAEMCLGLLVVAALGGTTPCVYRAGSRLP